MIIYIEGNNAVTQHITDRKYPDDLAYIALEISDDMIVLVANEDESFKYMTQIVPDIHAADSHHKYIRSYLAQYIFSPV